MELALPDLRVGYVEVLRRVLLDGRPVTTRGLATRELTNVTLVFDDPLAPLLPVGVGRRVNLRLAAVEALTLVAGESRGDLLRRASPDYARVLVDPGDLDYGAYGPRVAAQVRECVQLLSDDPFSRRAVATIWREADLTHVGDRPCTIFLQFLLRDRADERTGLAALTTPLILELHVTMRSQDAWLGVPYDVFMFSQLQHTVARELRALAGPYVHHVTSLHLYESNVEAATAIVAAHEASPELPPCDDLPLGLVPPDDGCDSFDFARLVLADADVDDWDLDSLGPAARNTNRWYADRMAELRRRSR